MPMCLFVNAGAIKLRKTKESKSDFFHSNQMRFLVLDGLCLSWFAVKKHVQQVVAVVVVMMRISI